LKKSMELSILCGNKVMLCVFDKSDKLTYYTTDGDTLEVFQNTLNDKNVEKEFITDSDVKLFKISIKIFFLQNL
jgi:hypothetical protein